ncbi:hypothetical protein ACFXGI_05135 [Streptomyces sp. NPDC059355]|uniref:hypothetical protein n=1 Tax=Streptomyces sp. NPDC059355 TaxID=3346811 RepID=UPI0036902412
MIGFPAAPRGEREPPSGCGPGRVLRPGRAVSHILGREHRLPPSHPASHPPKEYGISFDAVDRFLTALDPAHREAVGGLPRAEQERLAAAWEEELERDTDIDTLDELSPPAAESEAARRVMERLSE